MALSVIVRLAFEAVPGPLWDSSENDSPDKGGEFRELLLDCTFELVMRFSRPLEHANDLNSILLIEKI